MRLINFFTVVIVFLVMASCTGKAQTKKSLNTELDSVSYALGLNMGNQLKMNFDDVNKDLFIQGFESGLDSTDILMNEIEISGLLRSFFQKKQVANQARLQEEAIKKAEVDFAEVKKAGEAFLAENKSKEGVQTTQSGLQYIVLKEGQGEKPVATNKVKVHYHGTLIDGTVFDSSVDRGTPSEFFVNQVIEGWTEGLQLMKVGSKYKFFIPQELAYGATPRQGGPIKPLQALVFEVELLEIVQ
jgi:FKBP-type peptidyl-prolyl cis-trans isomerase FklB